jgi:hypothetical protein
MTAGKQIVKEINLLAKVKEIGDVFSASIKKSK